MKTAVSFLLIFIAVSSFTKTNAQNGIDTTFEILKKIDYKHYEGKPVDSLLQRIPANYQSVKIISSHKGYYASDLFVQYANEVVLTIHVDRFTHMDPFWNRAIDPQPLWDITLFKQEDNAYTILWRGPICYVGCEHARSH